MKTNIKDIKTLALVPLFGLSMHSCQNTPLYTEHTNVVVRANNIGVLIKDTETDTERLIDLLKYRQEDGCLEKNLLNDGTSSITRSFVADALFLQAGDTLKISSAYNYDDNLVLDVEHSTIKYDRRAVKLRKDMQKINAFKQQTQQEYQR